MNPEAATRGFLQRNVFLKIPQILQQNTCAIVFYVIKLQASACNFMKEEALVQVFFCDFCKIFKNAFFTELLWKNAPAESKEI